MIEIGPKPYSGTINLVEGAPLYAKLVFSRHVNTNVIFHWPDLNNGRDIVFAVDGDTCYIEFNAAAVYNLILDYRNSFYNRVPYLKIFDTYIRFNTINIVDTGVFSND